MSRIRKPAVAGLFYPSDPAILKNEVARYLSQTPQEKFNGEMFGIIVPHAGYIYSGRTACFAFNLLRDINIRTVIIISPSHREYFPGISLYDGDAFETPLGTVEIDQELAESLLSGTKEIMRSTTGHLNEHAVEVEIPFLQSVLKEFKIVPLVMGDQKPLYINELARKLADVYDKGIILLASSDLSHYYPRTKANQMDSLVEQRIENFEYERLMMEFETKHCEACGAGPIVALMKAASLRRFNKSLILHRTDSGEASGNTSEVVGYLSAVIYR